jgi:hypothetical protein
MTYQGRSDDETLRKGLAASHISRRGAPLSNPVCNPPVRFATRKDELASRIAFRAFTCPDSPLGWVRS